MWTSDRAYDRFMGRFSRRLAPLFADFAGARGSVLDVGAGTGALTAELVRRGLDVHAAEPSVAFVASLQAVFPGVDVRHAGAEDLPWPDGTFDVALAQLVIAFMSDAPAGVREMERVVRSGGTVAVCMWDREGMDLLAAINRARNALGDPGEGVGPYRTRDSIEGLMPGATMQLLEVDADYTDFEDFWTALTGGAGPAGVWAASLDEEQRAAARTELFRQVGRPEGAFTLTGRAWAAKATRA